MTERQKDMLVQIAKNWLELIGNNSYYTIRDSNTSEAEFEEHIQFIEALFDLQANGYIVIKANSPNMMNIQMMHFTNIALTQKGKEFLANSPS
ncbi:hypothetical protein [Helicobacter canis]|uniref:Uncharacterized protein n=1 Tax=Helicobacter canis NCTC 12740 TaxID=1357399 RepID=V8CDZ3_9HELI|nr:hypothetical protein [Helicobacter canis]ETD25638.1 hypothetical protein HMPREF2087_01466 [Helicobacter canis NCTC 12740]